VSAAKAHVRSGPLNVARSLASRLLWIVPTWCLALGGFARNAAAQGCAMCYQNAAASGVQGRAALRHGILILLLPACSVFLGICALIYHRRNASR
jgi:hypothetical protein